MPSMICAADEDQIVAATVNGVSFTNERGQCSCQDKESIFAFYASHAIEAASIIAQAPIRDGLLPVVPHIHRKAIGRDQIRRAAGEFGREEKDECRIERQPQYSYSCSNGDWTRAWLRLIKSAYLA